LQNRDNGDYDRQWQEAWVEYDLWDVAVRKVRRYLGNRFPQHVDDVASEALITLQRRGILRCRTIQDIVPLLRKIAIQEVVNFLRRHWARREVLLPENEGGDELPLNEREEVPPEDGEDNLQRLKDQIAECLHLHGFDLETFLSFLVTIAELNLLQEALLRGPMWVCFEKTDSKNESFG